MSTDTEPAETLNKLECWERNGELDLCATIDVDEFLADRVEKNEELDNEYREWVEENGLDLDYHSALMFATDVRKGAGIYGDGEPFCHNTYNGPDSLSCTLQFVYWEEDEEAFVLLQKHGGGDPRENYPPPQAYTIMGYEKTVIFDNARATIFCNDCDASWDTDDDYRWYGTEHGDDLREYRASSELDHDAIAAVDRMCEPYRQDSLQRPLSIDLPARPGLDSALLEQTGVVYVDDEHNAHCPRCGGLLAVAGYPAG